MTPHLNLTNPVKNETRMVILTILFLFLSISSMSQQHKLDSLLEATLKEDSLFLEELMKEEASIIDLIDSLILLTTPRSSMTIRLSYTSNVAYAGRNFGVSQFGFSSGLAYYHRSGIFADVSGYWNSEVTPNYNPTILSTGYLGTIGKKFSYIINYDHYFYSQDDNNLYSTYPLTNALSGSGYFSFKNLSAGLDYSFLFGEETANRIRGNLIGKIGFDDKWIFDRISISPGASILFGNQNIYSFNQSYQFERAAFFEDLINEYGYLYLYRLRRNNIEKFRSLLREKLPDYIYTDIEDEQENVFGFMNYSFSLPVYFTIKNYTIALSFHHNIPLSLPGEEVEYEPNSYFSVSLLYNLIFK